LRVCVKIAAPRHVIHWEIDGEYGAAVRMIARADVAAVKARVLGGDRQAQSAALGPGPCRIGLIEPVEQVRDRGRW